MDADINELREDISELGENLSKCIKIYNTVNEMINDFKASDMICKVLDSEVVLYDEQTYKPSRPNYYEYTSNPEAYEYALSNGGYAKLVVLPLNLPDNKKSVTEFLPVLLNTAYSYCGVTRSTPFILDDDTQVTNIRYQASSGPYATTTEGLQGIQCSQFVHAMLRALTYESSKLESEDNVNASEYGSCSDFLYEGEDLNTLSASQIAHLLAAKGQFKATKCLNDADIGDILFLGSTENTNTWRNIGHCAIVVGKLSNAIMVVQAGSIPSINGFSRSRNRPGFETDAVNFDFITPIDTDFTDGTYSMIGLGRVSYGFAKKAPTETFISISKGIYELTGSYTANQSNVNIHILKTDANKSYRFGVVSWGGYTGKKNSGAGMRLVRSTVDSAFPATGVEITTSSRLTNGGIIPALFNCDGRSKIVSLAFVVQTSSATEADSYLIRDLITDFYK